MLNAILTAQKQLKDQNRYRTLNLPGGIDLTSNDYLGMAAHPLLRETAILALQSGLDIGAAGSRLLRGHTKEHHDLEDFAANHFASPRTLYFSSGFQANYALFTTLPSRNDLILYDALIHASARDGIQASNARGIKFEHNDLNALEDLLKRHRNRVETTWIAIESLYSMDGDFAPIKEMLELSHKYDSILIVDEAHATGIYKKDGKGLCWPHVQQENYDRLITLHTCGKAIGVAGGLVCAQEAIIDFLINKARPFIYSTAPIPLQALLVQKSLEILASPDGENRRQKLLEQCRQAQSLFGGPGTQIVPIILGSDENALTTARLLQDKGYDIRAIRPPTVPEGTARLRLSLSSELQSGVLQDIANVLKSAV